MWGIYIYIYLRIPDKQAVFQWKVKQGFFRGSHVFFPRGLLWLENCFVFVFHLKVGDKEALEVVG